MRIKALCLAAALSLCALAHAQSGGITIGNGGSVTIAAGAGGGGTGGSGNATSLQGQAISASTPTDKQALVFDISTGLWKPQTLAFPQVGACPTAKYMTSVSNSAVPTCAQIQYSDIAGVPVNNVVYTGSATSGQFAQFTDPKTIQPVGSTGTGNVVLDTDPVIKHSLDVTGGSPGISNNGATWTANAGAPSGSCTPGSIYSNTAATSSSNALFVCYGAWTAVQLSPGSTTQEIVGNLGEYDFDGSSSGPTLTTTGSPTVVSTNTFTAPGAADFNTTGSYYSTTFTSSTATLYARAEIQVNTASSGTVRLFGLYNGTSEIGNVYLAANSGYVTMYNDGTSSGTACSSAALSSGVYHLIEFQWISSATAGGYTVKIDGSTACTKAGINTGSANVTGVRFGEIANSASPWDVEFDNVGFANNGWLGGVSQ